MKLVNRIYSLFVSLAPPTSNLIGEVVPVWLQLKIYKKCSNQNVVNEHFFNIFILKITQHTMEETMHRL